MLNAAHLPPPLAVWDSKTTEWLNRSGQQKQQIAQWIQAHLTAWAHDAYRIEFHLINEPFAVIHLYARNREGRKYHDPVTGHAAAGAPDLVPLAELPPDHLLH